MGRRGVRSKRVANARERVWPKIWQRRTFQQVSLAEALCDTRSAISGSWHHGGQGPQRNPRQCVPLRARAARTRAKAPRCSRCTSSICWISFPLAYWCRRALALSAAGLARGKACRAFRNTRAQAVWTSSMHRLRRPPRSSPSPRCRRRRSRQRSPRRGRRPWARRRPRPPCRTRPSCSARACQVRTRAVTRQSGRPLTIPRSQRGRSSQGGDRAPRVWCGGP